MSNKKGGGLLFGIIMGTILGVLFAPKKGKELRNDFKKEVQKGGIGAKTLKSNFVEMGSDMSETAQKIYENKDVQKHLNKGQNYLKKVVKDAKNEINNVKNELFVQPNFKTKPLSKNKKSTSKSKPKN